MTTNTVVQNFQAKKNTLDKQIILITGAGDGIGRSAALAFAQAGATVILTGLTMSKLEAVYDEIENLGGAQPAIFPLNLESATEQDYLALADAIQEEFGHLDGLLHNAAELGARSPISHYPSAQWEKVMRINVTAPFLLTKALMANLEAAKSASIVFTSANVAEEGAAYWGAYSVSKAASDHLMRLLADEVQDVKAIRVNAIDPVCARTQLRAKAYPAEDPTNIVLPDSFINAYIYLFSQESEKVNGQRFCAQ